MRTEITLSDYEVKEIIRKFLLEKGYNLTEAMDQRDIANYSINIVNNKIVVVIGT